MPGTRGRLQKARNRAHGPGIGVSQEIWRDDPGSGEEKLATTASTGPFCCHNLVVFA